MYEEYEGVVYLSRRNLITLLNKLDLVRMGGTSACALIKRDNQHDRYPQRPATIAVVALENENYYVDRPPGDVLEEDIP